ncbi:penicillin acylase family protein [Lacibacter sediminis]|uniref:Penicillin acylase family protein n=1 Tax=Lacibacter sediminis TaxID=2760713 RepID=A0A7G5XD69_9BACT|nr:penicillin acylase family protein [Lacibacter sediminis]QNA43422.1 penicillin acylase family protein [Lacibacter sediminis]
MKKSLTLLTFFILLVLGSNAQNINPKNIEIVRDSFGVPHIFAKTDAEVAYGLAWAHAEDDFKSLQDVVLPAKGLMGKVQGKAGAAGDYAFALFRCMEITEAKWNTLTPAFLKLIDGYVQGINAYAKAHPNEVLHKKIFPITAKEYIASSVLALTAFNGADKALMAIFNNTIETDTELNKKGSNAMAIHPTKTNTGEAFLLINAHQPNTGSQAFYEAHINSEEGLNVHGGLLAGGPCILHGVNENLGWAHTVNYVDRVDVFQLEMNPANQKQYKFDGEWIDLEEKIITLRIKGIPVGVKRKVYWSKYGATMKNKQGFFSIRLGANMDIRALEQWYYMDKAKNFTEFYAAIKDQRLSMFNITYADKHDTIFYVNNGLVPVRNPAPQYNWKSTLPGNTSQTLWTGFRKFRELPQYVNPKNGYVFNTNHSSFFATDAANNLKVEQFPLADGWETWHNNRSMRVVEQMPDTQLDYTTFKKIKFDKQLPDTLRYPYNIDTMFILNETTYPQVASLITTLNSWDKKGTADSKGAAVFLLSYLHLSKILAGQPARSITLQEALTTYQFVHDYMMKHFGKTDLTLGDIQKLVRGDKEWPLWGFPDLLSPQWTANYKDGKLKSVGGDGLIMFVRFTKNALPQIETVNMYGASAKKGNKHFDDQVEMYINQQTKHMTLKKEDVYKMAERVYHPGE